MDRTAYAHDPKQLAKLRSDMEKSNEMAVNSEEYETWSAHHNTAVDLMLLLDSKYSPRAIQTQNAEGNWGVVAQKIYFPMAGKTMLADNAGQQKSAFLMFGLCEKSIFTEARYVAANAESYAKIAHILDYQKDPEAQKTRIKLQVDTLKYISDTEKNIKLLEDELIERKESLRKLEEVDEAGEPATEERKQEIKSSIAEIEIEIDEQKSNVVQNKEFLEKIAEKNSPEYTQKLISQTEKNVGKEIGYTFASDDSNCASMAIRILRAGGAENFVKFSAMSAFGISMIKPDEHFSNYAANVQGEIDKWNQRAGAVFAKLERQAPLPENTIQIPPEWKNVGSNDGTLWPPVMETVSKNLPAASDDMSTLTQKIKNLVAAAEELLSQPAASKLSTENEKGMEILQIAFNMHKASITALTVDDDVSSDEQDIPGINEDNIEIN